MYDREKAVAYARKWAFGRNPAYYDFSAIGGDCTNFASQCLYAGSGEMNYTPTLGWYYISLNDRAPAWTGVDELFRFLVTNTGAGPKGRVIPLSEVLEGDIIQLRFSDEGRFDHSPIVVDRGAGTARTILLAAHTNDALDRPLASYNYRDLRAIRIE